MKLKSNSSGFARWMVLAGIVLIIFVSLAGWVAAHKGSSSKQTAAPASSAKSKATTKKNNSANDQTASPPSKAYKVTFPASWVKRTCSGNNLRNFLMLAPSTSLLGNCTKPPFGMVFINKYSGDFSLTEDQYNSNPYYKDLVYSSVTVGSLPGYSIDYIVGARTSTDPPSGTAEASYHLYDDNTNQTYVAAYSQRSTTPSAKDTFQSIAKSLTIPK